MSAGAPRLVAADHAVAAGKMTAIGLEPIKARLGTKWEKLSGLIHALFEAAIKRSLKPGDKFFTTGELTFIVIYRNVLVAEAQLRCAEVARGVCARLFGEEGSEISIRNLVGPIEEASLSAQDPVAAIRMALERNGTETIVWPDRNPSESARAPSSTLELKFTQQSGQSVHASPQELAFAYRPIWDCSFDMIITYMCQPVPPGQVAAEFNGGFCTACGSDLDRAALDRAVLSHCSQRLDRSRQEGSRVFLAIPVHFSTLAHPPAWAHFNMIYQRLTADELRHLIFVIFGLQRVPNNDLLRELPKLKGVRHLFCALEWNDPVRERFQNTAVHAVGIETPLTTTDEAKLAGFIKTKILDIRSFELEPFVFGVRSTSAVLSAMNAGARYLEGPAIHHAVEDPRLRVAFGLEDIYGNRLRSGLINIKRI